MLNIGAITEKLKAMNKSELLSLACEVLNDSGIEYTLGSGIIHFEPLSSDSASKSSSFQYILSNTATHCHMIKYSSDASGSSLKGAIEYDKYDSALRCYKPETISAA